GVRPAGRGQDVEVLRFAAVDLVADDLVVVRAAPDVDAFVAAAADEIRFDAILARLDGELDAVPRAPDDLVADEQVSTARAKSDGDLEALDAAASDLGSVGFVEEDAFPSPLTADPVSGAIEDGIVD